MSQKNRKKVTQIPSRDNGKEKIIEKKTTERPGLQSPFLQETRERGGFPTAEKRSARSRTSHGSRQPENRIGPERMDLEIHRSTGSEEKGYRGCAFILSRDKKKRGKS